MNRCTRVTINRSTAEIAENATPTKAAKICGTTKRTKKLEAAEGPRPLSVRFVRSQPFLQVVGLPS